MGNLHDDITFNEHSFHTIIVVNTRQNSHVFTILKVFVIMIINCENLTELNIFDCDRKHSVTI